MASASTELLLQDKGLAAFLRKQMVLGRDTTPITRVLATILENDTRQRFAEQRDPGGGQWKTSQRVENLGGKTLTLSAALGDSVGSRYGRDFVAWGTNRPDYENLHQYGFYGNQQVPSHTRRISQAFGKPIAPREVTVGAHVRRMRVVARAFIHRDANDLERLDLMGEVAGVLGWT